MIRDTTTRRAGLSLIELLVVIAILAAISGMVIALTDNMDSRGRYDESARRLSEIRSAILGPDAVSTSGDLLAGGYLQDTGWLPDAADDLIRPPEISPGTPMPKLAYDATWKTWFGWRGPYLTAPPVRKAGGSLLYDGWGNDFTGWFAITGSMKAWEIPRLQGDYPIRSLGSDNLADGAGDKTGVYERDYPDVDHPLIREAEWCSNLQGLQVEVTNLSAVDFSASPVQVRLRIIVPRWNHASDPLGAWPADPDSDEFIGRTFSLSVASAAAPYGQNRQVYDFGDPLRPLRVPHGRRMLFLVRSADGRPLSGVQAYTELLLSRRLSPPACIKLLIGN
jgi:prepilin-type N-terminal cleavage/methylation domain-containing protein